MGKKRQKKLALSYNHHGVNNLFPHEMKTTLLETRFNS